MFTSLLPRGLGEVVVEGGSEVVSGILGTSSTPLEMGGVSEAGGVISGSVGSFGFGSSSSGSVDSIKLTSN